MTGIRVGNAPCSWGTLEFEGLGGESVDYSLMLDELAETEYTGTELGDWGYMPTDPENLRKELSRRGLTMLGAFVPVAFKKPEAHAAGEEHALRVARLLASSQNGDRGPFVVLADENGTNEIRTRNAGRITPELELSAGEWLTYARGVERVARAVQEETGLACVFHHHCAGYVETPEEIGRLLSMTDPDLVGLVFDTGHYAYGAGSCSGVVEGLERFRGRIRHVHFKDCKPELALRAREEAWDYFTALKHGIFCELGRGCVDFPSILATLLDNGYSGWVVVEQDVLPGLGSPKVSALRNRKYLREIGL
jgi:inosose dehydratase